MAIWLGVASAEHVRRGVGLGIGQIGHGKRAGLARLRAGDALLYYSPVERLGDRRPLRRFTAFGQVEDDEIWQADEGSFQPYRRRVAYLDVRPVDLAEVKGELELTAGAGWGYQLRRGLVALTDGDGAILRERMLDHGLLGRG
jgi:hypothetical protein